MINLIAAMTRDKHVIGKKNWLPWDIPDELQHFRKATSGGTVIMGRKTYDSIGRLMPKRHNIIVTRQQGLQIQGGDVCHSVPEAMALAKKDRTEIWIIGGAEIYQEAIPLTERMELSYIKKEYDGDTYFPKWNKEEWDIEKTEDHPEWILVVYKRKKNRSLIPEEQSL